MVTVNLPGFGKFERDDATTAKEMDALHSLAALDPVSIEILIRRAGISGQQAAKLAAAALMSVKWTDIDYHINRAIARDPEHNASSPGRVYRALIKIGQGD